MKLRLSLAIALLSAFFVPAARKLIHSAAQKLIAPPGGYPYPLRPGLGRVSGVEFGCFSSEPGPRFFIR